MDSLVKNLQLDINKAMSICVRHGVKVYPVPVGKLFLIEVDKGNGKIKRYNDSLVSSKNVATAQRKTYIAYAKQILKQREDAN